MADPSTGTFKLAGLALMATGIALVLTSAFSLASGGTATLPGFFNSAVVGAGATGLGYLLQKAPDYAAAPAAVK